MPFLENLIVVNGSNNTNIGINQELQAKKYVLVVGGANIEYLYKQKTKMKLRVKQGYDEKTTEYGGSGLNYTLRLLNTGVDVFPILPIGNDNNGKRIVEKLKQTKERANIIDGFNYEENDFLYEGIDTVESLIVSDTSSRTIWSNDNSYVSSNTFSTLMDRGLTLLFSQINHMPSVVMIGHIHSDKEQENNQDLSTRKLIETYHNNSLIYLNFGRSQLEYGFEFWREDFRKVDVLQFNFSEIRLLFENDGSENMSLREIIDEFSDFNASLIITLDKLGALCVFKEEDEKHIVYVPYVNLDSEYKDKTGAGDAFASGIVYYMLKKFQGENIREMRRSAWEDALETGRAWAAYACRTLGGASHCPTEIEISNFRREIRRDRNKIVAMEDIYVDLIDKAYGKD